jgi:hypothetical protein
MSSISLSQDALELVDGDRGIFQAEQDLVIFWTMLRASGEEPFGT